MRTSALGNNLTQIITYNLKLDLITLKMCQTINENASKLHLKYVKYVKYVKHV